MLGRRKLLLVRCLATYLLLFCPSPRRLGQFGTCFLLPPSAEKHPRVCRARSCVGKSHKRSTARLTKVAVPGHGTVFYLNKVSIGSLERFFSEPNPTSSKHQRACDRCGLAHLHHITCESTQLLLLLSITHLSICALFSRPPAAGVKNNKLIPSVAPIAAFHPSFLTHRSSREVR